MGVIASQILSETGKYQESEVRLYWRDRAVSDRTPKALKTLGFLPFVVASNLQPELDVERVKVIGRVPARCRQPFVDTDPNIAAFILQEVYRYPALQKALEYIGRYANEQLADVKADIFHLNSFSSTPSPILLGA